MSNPQQKPKSIVNILVMAIIVLSVCGVLAVTLIIVLLPERDNTKGIMVILGFLVPVITALLGKAIGELHHTVNGRLDKMMETFGNMRFIEGQEDERTKDKGKDDEQATD